MFILCSARGATIWRRNRGAQAELMAKIPFTFKDLEHKQAQPFCKPCSLYYAMMKWPPATAEREGESGCFFSFLLLFFFLSVFLFLSWGKGCYGCDLFITGSLLSHESLHYGNHFRTYRKLFLCCLSHTQDLRDSSYKNKISLQLCKSYLFWYT